MARKFEGIFAALTTPFLGDEIAWTEFAKNLERYNATDLAGYVALGSTGECVSLTDEDAEAVVRAVRKSAGPGKHVIAGSAREATRLTVDFTNRLADVGIEAALVRPPCYYKSRLTRDALKAHYLAVADAARVPILIYNVPANTGIALDGGLIVELAGHPNIIGLKDSSANIVMLGEIIRRLPQDFHYFLGSGSAFMPALEMGACGAILAVANAAPEICAKIYSLFREGKIDESRKLQLDLIPLNKAVMEGAGIAGLKYALDLRGYYGGPARLPILPPDEKTKAELASQLKRLGII